MGQLNYAKNCWEIFNKIILEEEQIINFDKSVIISSLVAMKENEGVAEENKSLKKTIKTINKYFDFNIFSKKQLKSFPSNFSHHTVNSLKFMAKYGAKGALFSLQAAFMYYALPIGQVAVSANLASLNTLLTPAIFNKIIPGAIASLTTELQSKLMNQFNIQIEDFLSNYLDEQQAIAGSPIAWSKFFL